MPTLKEVQEAIKQLSPEELSAFREWFWEFDWEMWERQLEEDIKLGKLDALAEEAIRDWKEGRCRQV